MQDIEITKTASKAIPVKEAPSEMSHSKLDTNTFKTPEETASSDTSHEPGVTVNGQMMKPRQKKSFMAKLKGKWTSLSKKQKIITAVVAVIVLVGVGGTVYAMTRSKPAPKPVAKVTPKPVAPVVPVSTTVASPLTGMQVSPDVLQRPVTGVMIENSPDARPQSSLDQAGVVFEAVAEGGITRFLALFMDSQPTYIGPVRSARPYYLQWCLSFDCALAHAGGSPEALADIPAWGVKNLDEFANSGAFHRISSRFAPHNLYTGQGELNALETSKGFGAAKFTGFVRKSEAPAKTLTASVIDFQPSSADYASHYQYDGTKNFYVRSEGGVGHMQVDSAGKPNPITPKVVVALIMNQGIEPDDQHTSYTTLGSGPARVFQDGTEVDCTWHKPNLPDPLTLTDANNQPIKLDPGQTWLTVLGSTGELSFK